MRWYKNLYFGEGVNKDAVKAVKQLKAGKSRPELYVIVLAQKEGELLELYPSWTLNQEYYRRQDLLAVGLAHGYEEAKALTAVILQDVYDRTGTLSVKEYFETQE